MSGMAEIVAADDDPDIRHVVDIVLSRAGHDVTLCHDGVELVETVRESHPDVVVTDNQMPGMTGLEARQALRESPDTADIPVVLATGSVTPTEAATVLGDGDQLVAKPFQPAELKSAVNAALRYAGTTPT